jgi:gamma-glutamylcysteine synthetase
MGTWGAGPFDNDDAIDWVQDLVASDEIELLVYVLSGAAASEGYLGLTECNVAIAAATVVACSKGISRMALPDEVEGWVDRWGKNLTQADAVVAANAVERCLREGSELAETLAAQIDDSWRGQIESLLVQLRFGSA